MKKIKFFAISLLIISVQLKAQVTGIKTITVDYPTIEAAVLALNTTGVGVGGATINVPAGYTETPSTSLVLTMTTSPSSLANPLVFQKSGAGANPVITAFTPGVSTTVDGIFILNGVDYVTINGIDLAENAANVTATTQMEWGYALVKTSATNGAQNNTIKNCVVTLNKANIASVGIYGGNHITANTTALTVSSLSGANSFNKFYNNTVQNCYQGYSFTGFAAAAPYDLYDQNNQIGVDGVSTRRSQVVNFGGNTTTANGVNATNQNNIKVFNTYINNSGGAAQLGVLNGINLVTGLNSNVDIYGDSLTLSSSSTFGNALYAINNAMGGTGAGNTVNIYNNVIDACVYSTNTSGEFRGISQSATASYSNLYNNKVTNNSIPGTGQFSGIYYGGGSATLVLLVSINSNTVSNNTKTGTAGPFNCIYASSSTNGMNTFNNILTNNNNSTSSGPTYGYFNFAFGYNENVYNNMVSNLIGGTGDVIALNVRSGSGPTNKEVYGNTISNISGNTATNVEGIKVGYGTLVNVYKNSIFNITNTNATGGTPATAGIEIDGNVNTQVSVYNNFISDLKAPNASNTNAIFGIWLQGATASNLSAFYNTIYLNATSIGANFGTSGITCGTAPLSIDLRNNIVVNASTFAGTGLTRALTRGNTTLTNYNLNSGYNCLYAGVPSANNLIFHDGTNSDQTLQAFKNRVCSREQSSFSSIPPFVNIVSTPYDLHLQTGTPTQCEGGGTPIAGNTIDFDGNTRNLTTPDVGADEITGTTVDIASPNIQYNLLGNSSVALNRNLTNFANITDPSGINTTIGTRPRIYYKRSTNANTYAGNTNTNDGWKFVEASNTSSPFNFLIDYTLLFGGAVAAGDVIQYFVTAQDLNSTPIVGINSGGFTSQPANVSLAAGNFPLNNTINQYTIVSTALSGTINVGPAELITSITNAGGIFQTINNSALSGNLTINITGDMTTETGTFPLNQWSEEGVGNYSVTIVPSAAVTRNIYGSSVANSLIRFDGADRVVINGNFSGSGSYLMFRNTSNAAPTIGFLNDAQNNIVKFTVIESGNSATSTILGGAILIGSTTGINGNDNITIDNCEIRDRSDLTATPAIGINCVGANGILSQFNNNCSFTNNKIHDWFLANSANQFAINVGAGNTGFSISNNSFYQTSARTNLISGAVTRAININNATTVNSNGGFSITTNYIGGTAPLATGGDMTLTVSGAGVSQTFNGITVTSGLIPNSIQGNIIRNIDFTTNSPAAATSLWLGISTAQGIHNIGTTSGNIIGSATGNSINKINVNSGGTTNTFLAGIFAASAAGYVAIQNNTIGGITIAGTTTAGIVPQWIQNQGTPSQSVIISNNLIGSTSTANSIVNNVNAPLSQFGIRHLITSGAPLSLTSNTIQNITDNSTSATSVNYGILAVSTVGGSSQLTFTNNVVKNLSVNSSYATAAFANAGISIQNFGGVNHSINSNTISGISSVNTGAFSNYVAGVFTLGNSFGATINKNYIHSLSNLSTGNPGIEGIYMSSGINMNVSNNMISLNNGANTNAVDLNGIVDFTGSGGTSNIYYNSVYIGGTASSGTLNTSAFNKGSLSSTSIKNNLFYNERAGGTGTHVAISNVLQSGWSNASSNYNAFITADTSKVSIYNGTAYNLTNWKSNTLGDGNSQKSINTVETPATLFISSSTGNLHINTSTFPAGLATPIAILDDIDGNTRSLTFPAVGADEIACATTSLSILSQTNITCFGGNNGAATFSASGGSIFTYSWAPITNILSSANTLTAGVYTVTAFNSCSISATQTVNITQPSALSINTNTTSTNLCAGNSASLNVTGTGGTGSISYTWMPGSLTTTAIVVNPTTSIIYTVNAVDASGCLSNVVTTSITVNTTPTITVNSGSICSGSSFTIVPSGASTYTISGGSSVVTPTITSSYNVTGTSSFGCVSSNTAVSSITVNAIPVITVPSTTICAGATGTLSASGANTYTWNTGSNATSISASPTINTTYTVTGASTVGCVSSPVTATIIVGSAPSIVVNSATVCAGNSATLSASGVTTYTWNTGANSASIVVTPSVNTTYTVSGNSTGCGVGASNTASVLVNASPTVSAISNSSLLCVGQSATLTASGAINYTWSSGGNSANEVISPTLTTSYTVTGNGSNGCTNVASITQSVSTCTGIQSNIANQLALINIYPNPNTGVFTVELPTNSTITIVDILGKIVYTQKLESGIHTINITNFNNGVYILKAENNGEVKNVRLIKE